MIDLINYLFILSDTLCVDLKEGLLLFNNNEDETNNIINIILNEIDKYPNRNDKIKVIKKIALFLTYFYINEIKNSYNDYCINHI